MMTDKQVSSVTNLRAALRYAKAGYPVLLVHSLNEHGQCTCREGKMCATPGKHAMQMKWQKIATTDADTINKWFARWPDAHVGIMPPEGYSIIDVDPRNGGVETIRRLIGNAKQPHTVMQNSGGGGYHLVYKGEPRGGLGVGIDVKRHRRGYVVAWPSAHVSGGAYVWKAGQAPWDVEPATLPDYFKGKYADNDSEFSNLTDDIYAGGLAPDEVPISTVREALSHIDADDYHRWVNIGQALKHAYGEEGKDLWLQWSQTSAEWQDGDEDKWESFDNNRDRPLLTIRTVLAIARKEGYRPHAAEFDETLWELGSIEHYLYSDPPPIEWVCQPCLPKGKVTVLSGAGGTSKSFLSLMIAMHAAIGEPFGPFVPRKGRPVRTLMIAAEEAADDVFRRVAAICKALAFTDEQKKLIADNLAVMPARSVDWRMLGYDENQNVIETSRPDYIIEQARLGAVELIVLDPLVKFNGGNENDNGEMAYLMAVLDKVAERTGAAVLVIHHVSKSGVQNEVTQASVRGASAIVDNARAAFVLTRLTKQTGPLFGIDPADAGRFVMCSFVKNNYGPFVDETMFAVGAEGVLEHRPHVQRVHNTMAQAQKSLDTAALPLRALSLLSEHEDGLSGRETSNALGRPHTAVNECLIALETSGDVRRQGVGNTSRWVITKRGVKTLEKGRNSDEDDGDANLV
jgi:hypothetical protein